MSVQAAHGPSPGGVATAYDVIKARILSGELQAGAVLVEQALSAQVGVSRTPVREALQALQKEGFVRIDRHRGASVAELDARDLRELYDLRICLERHALEEAFRREVKIEFAALDDALAAQERALEAIDGVAFLEADRAFHLAILACHGSSRIENIMLNVWDHVVRGTFVAMRVEPRQVIAFEEHGKLVEALRRHDLDEAIAASRHHLEGSMRRVLLGGDGGS